MWLENSEFDETKFREANATTDAGCYWVLKGLQGNNYVDCYCKNITLGYLLKSKLKGLREKICPIWKHLWGE